MSGINKKINDNDELQDIHESDKLCSKSNTKLYLISQNAHDEKKSLFMISSNAKRIELHEYAMGTIISK